MPSSWDTASELRLLLAVIEATSPKTPSWPAVAEMLGMNVTGEACRQHYQKIKRDFHNGTASAPGTPIKPAVPKTASSKCGRKRKGDEQCDFNGDSTPIKSAKSKLIGGPDDGSPTRKKVRADKTSATLTDSLEANEKPQGGKDSTGDTTEEEA